MYWLPCYGTFLSLDILNTNYVFFLVTTIVLFVHFILLNIWNVVVGFFHHLIAAILCGCFTLTTEISLLCGKYKVTFFVDCNRVLSTMYYYKYLLHCIFGDCCEDLEKDWTVATVHNHIVHFTICWTNCRSIIFPIRTFLFG